MFLFFSRLRQLVGNPYFARSRYDRLAFIVFVLGAHLAIWYELWIVMPFYPSTAFQNIHYLVIVVIYVNSFGNLYCMITKRVDVSSLDVAAAAESNGWHYCSPCMCFVPPRSHHCPVCDVCIMKRDHHCWFAGVCIGWHNHRYFCVMVLWVWFAAVYANIYHFTFAQEMLGSSFGTLLCLLVPHVAALLGYLTLSQFFISFLTFLAFLLLVMFSWMMQIQVTQIYAGQTKYEKKNNIRTYNIGWQQSVQEVFGNRWYLVWLWPWITSERCGNGYDFKSMKAL